MDYTFMSQEALEATCDANDKRTDGTQFPENAPYLLTLNRSDFRNLVSVLGWFYNHGPDVIDPDVQEAESVRDWSGDFVSGMAETLNVGMV